MDKPDNIQILKQIDAYLKGRLTEEEADRLWATLVEFPEYLELMETEVTLQAIYEERKKQTSTEKKQPPQENNTKAVLRFIYVAAAACILLVVGFLFYWQGGQTGTGEQLALQHIEVAQAENNEVLRTNKGNTPQIDSLLNVGFYALLNNDVSKAKKIYERIIKNYDSEPSVAMAHLNIGIIAYNLGNYKEAIHHFNNALSIDHVNILVTEKAHWYMGNAYLNLEMLTKARKHIYETYVMDGLFRKPAGTLLKEVDRLREKRNE